MCCFRWPLCFVSVPFCSSWSSSCLSWHLPCFSWQWQPSRPGHPSGWRGWHRLGQRLSKGEETCKMALIGRRVWIFIRHWSMRGTAAVVLVGAAGDCGYSQQCNCGRITWRLRWLTWPRAQVCALGTCVTTDQTQLSESRRRSKNSFDDVSLWKTAIYITTIKSAPILQTQCKDIII